MIEHLAKEGCIGLALSAILAAAYLLFHGVGGLKFKRVRMRPGGKL